MSPTIEKVVTARAIQLRDESTNYFDAVGLITRELDEVEKGKQNPLYHLAGSIAGVTTAGFVAEVGSLIGAIIGFITQMLAGKNQKEGRLQELRKEVEPIVSKIYEEG